MTVNGNASLRTYEKLVAMYAVQFNSLSSNNTLIAEIPLPRKSVVQDQQPFAHTNLHAQICSFSLVLWAFLIIHSFGFIINTVTRLLSIPCNSGILLFPSKTILERSGYVISSPVACIADLY